MLPIQEIEVRTNNKRVFSVHLEKWGDANFQCKLASIALGPQLPADAVFGPFATADSAPSAFHALIDGIVLALSNLDATDSISEVNNPCNTELVDASEQREILGTSVRVTVNGADA